MGIVDVEFGQHREVVQGLDALAERASADAARKADQSFDDHRLDVVMASAGDQAAIEFDEVRTQRAQAQQAGVTGACIVDGDQPAAMADLVHGRDERIGIGRRLLGDLDRDAAQVTAQGRPHVRMWQGVGADVDAERHVVGQFVAASQRLAQARRFEFAAPAGDVGGGEHGVDRGAAIVREASEGLGGDERTGRDADDRLQQDVDRAEFGQDLGQRVRRHEIGGRLRRSEASGPSNPVRPPPDPFRANLTPIITRGRQFGQCVAEY